VERPEQTPPVQSSVVVLGKEYAKLAPFLDKLLKLSPRDIRIVQGMVQLMHTENGGR
jgi:predicted Holliday junction resolvase-like endonuclease